MQAIHVRLVAVSYTDSIDRRRNHYKQRISRPMSMSMSMLLLLLLLLLSLVQALKYTGQCKLFFCAGTIERPLAIASPRSIVIQSYGYLIKAYHTAHQPSTFSSTLLIWRKLSSLASNSQSIAQQLFENRKKQKIW